MWREGEGGVGYRNLCRGGIKLLYSLCWGYIVHGRTRHCIRRMHCDVHRMNGYAEPRALTEVREKGGV